MGKLPPTREYPAPVTEADDRVTADVPLDERVTVSAAVELTFTVPKLRPVVLTPSTGFGATPVPLNETTELAPVVELLLMVNAPVIAPAAFGLKVICTVRDCPAARVVGTPLATIVKPVPVRVPELIVRGAVPEEVTVSERAFEEPSATLPKLSVLALRVMRAALATPVPVRLTTEVAPVVELLTTVNLPVRPPTVVGLKVTGTTKVCPAVRVLGRVVATIENPVPATVRELMVRGAVPEEVIVSESAFEVPSVTLPKLSVLALRVMPAGLATPVPVRLTTEVVPVAALSTMANLPVRLPAVVGLKVTGTTNVCPVVRVLGKVVAAMENPAPVAVSELMVKGAVPEEVIVSESAFEAPSVTLP
jgi:hypothetical protein